MLPASTAPRPSVRDLGAHRAPDGRPAFSRPVREGVPYRLADPGPDRRDHAVVAPLRGDDPRLPLPVLPDIRAVDISISPTGDELPAGHGNAKEGAEVYEQAGCISCHGEKGLDGPAPQLRSRKADNLPIWERERILPLRAPFATVVWDFINRGMPLGAEGSLSANEVYAVTAYLLFLNKVIPEIWSSTKTACRRSRCRSAMTIPSCLSGSTGRRGSRVTPTSSSIERVF